jgi:UDP-glucose 4-epimerase
MNRKKIVVTGAGGFLGRHLITFLQAQDVTVLPLSRAQGFDLCKPETLENMPDFDCMIHLAAHTFVPDSYNRTAAFFSNNINATLNALELCKKNKSHFIYASSYVYGQPAYLPVDENHPVTIWNPYAAGKIICEQLCHTYSKEFSIPVDILRIFNIYGPDQNPTFVIPKIINGVLAGQLNLETLTPKRDFIYVKDVCTAIFSCLETHQTDSLYAIYNIGSGTSYSIAQIIEKVELLTGKKANIVCNVERRVTEVLDVRADNSKLKKEKKWYPVYSIDEGLAEIISGLRLS